MDTVADFAAILTEELGLTIEIDTTLLLDIARDVAHGVARPAAPVSTAIVGAALASGQNANSIKAAVARAIERAEPAS